MENIMLQDYLKKRVKIIDFGLSNICTEKASLNTPCGSLEYAAPELFNDHKKYGPAVDLWSLGVVLYVMGCGHLPFVCYGISKKSEKERRERLMAQINRGLTAVQEQRIATMSSDYKSIVNGLLMPDAHERITIRELCDHPWITNRQRAFVKSFAEKKTSTAEHNAIVDTIATEVKMSRADIETNVKENKYGEIGGMYNILAHQGRVPTSLSPMKIRNWTYLTARKDKHEQSYASLNNSKTSPRKHPKNEIPTLSAVEKRITSHFEPKPSYSNEECNRNLLKQAFLHPSNQNHGKTTKEPNGLSRRISYDDEREKLSKMCEISFAKNLRNNHAEISSVRHLKRQGTPASQKNVVSTNSPQKTMSNFHRFSIQSLPRSGIHEPMPKNIEVKDRKSLQHVPTMFQKYHGNRLSGISLPFVSRQSPFAKSETLGQGDRVTDRRSQGLSPYTTYLQKKGINTPGETKVLERDVKTSEAGPKVKATVVKERGNLSRNHLESGNTEKITSRILPRSLRKLMPS